MRTFEGFDEKVKLVDWIELNKINNKFDDYFKYLGNHLASEDNNAYALFVGGTDLICIKCY